MFQALSYVRENISDRSYNSYRAHKDNFGVNNEYIQYYIIQGLDLQRSSYKTCHSN